MRKFCDRESIRLDVPWKDLEKQGWIATADVTEIRIPLTPDLRMAYALAEPRRKLYPQASMSANSWLISCWPALIGSMLKISCMT